MNVWTITEFTGFYPIGTSAVVVAPDEYEAASLLNKELMAIGLPASAKPDNFSKLDTTVPFVKILNDGNY